MSLIRYNRRNVKKKGNNRRLTGKRTLNSIQRYACAADKLHHILGDECHSAKGTKRTVFSSYLIARAQVKEKRLSRFPSDQKCVNKLPDVPRFGNEG